MSILRHRTRLLRTPWPFGPVFLIENDDEKRCFLKYFCFTILLFYFSLILGPNHVQELYDFKRLDEVGNWRTWQPARFKSSDGAIFFLCCVVVNKVCTLGDSGDF